MNVKKQFSKKALTEPTKRSAPSKFGRFLNDSKTKAGVAALTVLTAIGLTFIPPINPVNAEDKKKDKGVEVKKEKEKIDITDLKGYTEGKYEEINENENGFFFFVAVKEPIFMEDGKKAVKVYGTVSHDEEDLKKGGDEASSIVVLVFDTAIGGKSEAGWAVNVEDLRADYKESTGKELKYVHILVEHDDSSSEFLQLHVIAASSKKAVEKEIIEPEMPMKIFKLKKNQETGIYEFKGYSDFVTASLSKLDDKIIAKK